MNIWLAHIDIPDTVTEIGQTAFAGARLTELSIPASVEKIGRKAFHLHRITNLSIPGTVKVLEDSAFEGTYKGQSLKTLTLGEGIESIGDRCFKEGLLETVALPSSLKTLSGEPFENNVGQAGTDHVVLLTTSNPDHLAFNDAQWHEVKLNVVAVDLSQATVKAPDVTWTGKAQTPAVTVTLDGQTLVAGTDYTAAYANNVNVGTATVTVTGKGDYTGTAKGTFMVKPVLHVAYRTHVQSFGWQDYVRDGALSGTSGKAKRLEAINIKLEGAPVSGSIEYRTHVQSYGWQNYVKDGTLSGTSGKAKRLEAIQIRLTGDMAKNYDVWYRVHAQSYGWLGWAKNDEPAGTAGYSKRLEAIEIVLLPKGSAAPGKDYGAYVSKDDSMPAQSPTGHLVSYRTHVQSFGWQNYVYDGQLGGTSGKSKRLEALNVKLVDAPYSGSVEYRTHVQTYGWQNYVKDGALSGTSGQAKRLEAVQIRLTGQMAQHYDVYYRVHAQHFGWMGWAKNGDQAGTAGYSYRLEAIQVVLVEKGKPAPGKTYQGITQKYSTPFMQKK